MSDRRFRPDIQGLRAIAVLLVALGHAGVGFLQGGFVGVDVFFVISGFLITGWLLRRSEKSGRVPFSAFYAARARRILPAATLTIVVTVVAAWHWLNFIRALSVFHDAIWSAFFAANIHFSQIGTDYFASENPPSPLQHFWTLAVEEQFYIVWPALLAVLLYATGRRRPLLIATTAAVCIPSLVYCIRDTEASQVSAYFSTPARAWELGVGALLAMLATDLERLSENVRAALGWIGLGAILIAGIAYSGNTQFPGYAVLLPVLGSAFVLAGGLGEAPRRGVGAVVLQHQPFQFIGDVSYSFYLWHWPALVIAADYLGHKLSVLQNLGLLVVAFAVSAFTYLTFENPIRHGKRLGRPIPALALWPVTLVTVLVLANVAIAAQPNVSQSAPKKRPPIVALPLNRYLRLVAESVTPARLAEPIPKVLHPTPEQAYHDEISVPGCRIGKEPQPGTPCVLGDVNASRSFVVLGDSHAGAWLAAFDYFAQIHHYRLIALTRDGCTMGTLALPGHVLCAADWASWLQQLTSDHPQFLVVAQRFDTRVQTAQMYRGLSAELDAFDLRVPLTVVVEDPPWHPNINPVDCLLRPGAKLGDCTMKFPDPTTPDYSAVKAIVLSHTKARYLPTLQWFCTAGKCPLVIGDMIAYRDTHHISTTYARYIAPAVAHSLWKLTAGVRGN